MNFLNGVMKDFSSFELSEQLTGKIIEQFKSLSYLLNITQTLPPGKKFVLPDNFKLGSESQRFLFINILSPLVSSVKSILDEHNHQIFQSLDRLRTILMYLFIFSSCYQILAQITLTKTVAYIARKSKILLQIFLEIPDQILQKNFDKTELYMLSLQQMEGIVQESDDEDLEEFKNSN